MLQILFVFRWYFWSYISFVLRTRNQYDVAFQHLIQQKTHRIPKGLHKSLKTAISFLLRRIVLDVFKKGDVQFFSTGNTVIYNESIEPWTVDYIEQNSGPCLVAANFTPYNLTFKTGIVTKLIYLFFMFIVGILSLPLCIIRPIGIWALHLTIVHEHLKVILELKGKKIAHFYDFISYEIGSSFLSILLVKKGIRDYFITSPTPLYETYPNCVADVFLSTSPYHKDEIAYLKKNAKYPLKFIYNEIQEWPYNEFDENLELNSGKDYQNRKKLGLYVSGVWWRNKEKHQEFADGFFDSEFLLLEHARMFIENHTDFELWLYLHPRERRTPEQLQEALEFYNGVFKNTPYKLMDFSRPTKSQFSQCDISISVSSNTTYERLYGGFKSIFAPYYLPNFPIPGNPLEHICVRSYADLETRILNFDAMDTNAFFESTGLQAYHFKNKPFGYQKQ
jgi:hypothetical protein